jgi:hypothetical protein
MQQRHDSIWPRGKHSHNLRVKDGRLLSGGRLPSYFHCHCDAAHLELLFLSESLVRRNVRLVLNVQDGI